MVVFGGEVLGKTIGLDEVMRVGPMWDSRTAPSPEQDGSRLQARARWQSPTSQRRDLRTKLSHWHLRLGLPCPQNVEKFLLFKQLSVWCCLGQPELSAHGMFVAG